MNVQTCSYVERLVKRVHHTYLGLYNDFEGGLWKGWVGISRRLPLPGLLTRALPINFQLFWNFKESGIIWNENYNNDAA